MKPIIIQYRFQFEDGKEKRYQLKLDPQRLEAVGVSRDNLPDWSRLKFHQCPNCPLDPLHAAHCPAAVNMVGLVQHFAELLSYDKTLVVVITAERLIYSRTTIQRGVGSLLGLLMATSGCPLTAFFKPMARFHLPFASTEETIWRATSTYLLAQYFRHQKDGPLDYRFDGLSRIYSEIQKVNMAFAKRLRTACRHDSMVNAIILLDIFAKSMPTAIEDSLEEIRRLFAPYISCRHHV